MYNHVLSLDIGTRIKARVKECWSNSVLALLVLPELENAYYIEGFAYNDNGIPIPVEHGWIEHEGQIIDPTWAVHLPDSKGIYYPVYRYNKASVTKRTRGKWGLPYYSRDYQKAWGDPLFMGAYLESHRAAWGEEGAALIVSMMERNRRSAENP